MSERASYDVAFLYNRTLRDSDMPARLEAIAAALSTGIATRFDAIDSSALEACATLLPGGAQCPYGESARMLVERSQDALLGGMEALASRLHDAEASFQG